MCNSQYENALCYQCMSIPDLCSPQLSEIESGFENSGIEKILKGITKIITTGCGDSYFAACSAQKAFSKYAEGFGFTYTTENCIDLARFMDFPDRDNSNILVIGISASGSPVRIQESLLRASKHGCKTMVITNDSFSPAAKAAEYKLVTNTPSFSHVSPGLRSYFASLCSLYYLAAKVGEIKKMSPSGSVEHLLEEIFYLANAYAEELQQYQIQTFVLANRWKEALYIETIANNDRMQTASFIAAKFIEASGVPASATDTENWCHINLFFSNPQAIPIIAITDGDGKDKTRFEEMLAQADAIGRPIGVVCSGKEFIFPKSAEVFYVPKARDGYRFIENLFNYLPGSLIAGYYAALKGTRYFRGGIWSTPGVNTIKTSRLEIY